ncbi:hypothetical protein ACJMK2_026352 [Sinanodonta woodiana]|uniref:Ig-like domain-containing protein n=1 Tax=Sinanodonta woodiana TaxID=1069815 RepID=A0ABD3XJC6_SINWO
MNARLIITVLIFLVTVWFTGGLTWNTEIRSRSSVCCQGNTQLLIWNLTEEENERLIGLHWFFNGTKLVCFVSKSTGFVVGDLYVGRVEQNGTAGILLNNVSLNDAGEYTLHVKFEEKEESVYGINLTIVEPPPSQCKPIIKKEYPKGIFSCSTACERSPLSVEWYINGTKVPEVIEPYLVVDPLWTSEQPVCCLRDFKCVDDYQSKFCTPNNFSFTDDMPTVNQPVADTNYMAEIYILKILIVTQLILFILLIILRMRRCRLLHKRHYEKNHNMELQWEEPLSANISAMLKILQELEAKFSISDNKSSARD